jgi:hypothetical protein
MGQDLPEPRGGFAFGLTSELVPAADRLDQRLLDDVRRLDFRLEPAIELQRGQQV